MALVERIAAQEGSLAESEAKVARQILADPDAINRYTITGLANEAETSTSAVLRFCHSLGFSGYKVFRYELMRELRSGTLTSRADLNALSAAAANISSAIALLGTMDQEPIRELAQAIKSARATYCLGIHRSFLPAEKLRMELEDEGITAFSAHDTVQMTHFAYSVDEEVCSVLFSVRGHPKNYIDVLNSGLAERSMGWLITTNPRAKMLSQISHGIVLPTAGMNHPRVDDHAIMMAFVEMLSLAVRGY